MSDHKPTTAWAVKTVEGVIIPSSIRPSRSQAMDAYADSQGATWNFLIRKRDPDLECVQVIVTELRDNPPPRKKKSGEQPPPEDRPNILDRRVTDLPNHSCAIEIWQSAGQEWIHCRWTPEESGANTYTGYLGTARTNSDGREIGFHAWVGGDYEFRYFRILGNNDQTQVHTKV